MARPKRNNNVTIGDIDLPVMSNDDYPQVDEVQIDNAISELPEVNTKKYDNEFFPKTRCPKCGYHLSRAVKTFNGRQLRKCFADGFEFEVFAKKK